MALPYPLGARAAAEAIGTFAAVFLANSVVANDVLEATKGRNMGYGWVAT